MKTRLIEIQVTMKNQKPQTVVALEIYDLTLGVIDRKVIRFCDELIEDTHQPSEYSYTDRMRRAREKAASARRMYWLKRQAS